MAPQSTATKNECNGLSDVSSPSLVGQQLVAGANSTKYHMPTRTAFSSSSHEDISSEEGDKENNSTLFLDNIKSKLAQNRLRRQSRIDSLRSVLSYSTDRASDRNCNMSKNSFDPRIRDNKDSHTTEKDARRNKRYKVDLAPRIVVSSSNSRVLIERTNNVITSTPPSLSPSRTTTTQRQKVFSNSSSWNPQARRTQKYLTQSNGDACSNSSSSNDNAPPSSDDPFFERLNAMVRVVGRKEKKKDDSHKIDQTGALTDISSNTGSQTASFISMSGSWLSERMMAKAETAPTFLVSPIIKRSDSAVGSYIGSIHFNENNCTDTSKPTDSGSLKGGVSASQEFTGPCISGSLNLKEGKRNPSLNMSLIKNDRTDKKHFANATAKGGMNDDGAHNIQQTKSFPPQSICDDLCIDQVPSEMSETDKSMYPHSSPRQNNWTNTACSSSTPAGNHSLVPSAAASVGSQSLATSTATTTTASSQRTNLFDLLRSINPDSNVGSSNDDADECRGEEYNRNETGPPVISRQRPCINGGKLSVKPPLSPVPRGRKTFSKAHKGQKTRRSTPRTSPVILVGTPNSTSTTKDTSVVGGSTSQTLEYSFLANALRATNVLASPNLAANKQLAKTVNTPISEASPQLCRANPTEEALKVKPKTKFTTRTCKEENGIRPEKKQRTPLIQQQENNASKLDEPNDRDYSVASSAHDRIFSIASALDDASSHDSLLSQAKELDVSQEKQLASLNGLVETPENKISSSNIMGGCSEGHAVCSKLKETNTHKDDRTDHKKTAASRGNAMQPENTSELGRIESHLSERTVHVLKERVAMLERRVEQEMEKASQNTLTLTTDLETVKNGHRHTESYLRQKVSELESEKMKQNKKLKYLSAKEEMSRQKIQCLESQLEVERKKVTEHDAAAAKIDFKAKASETAELELEGFKRKQCILKKEFVSCAKDNDILRRHLLSLANETSTKKQTLSTALSQLKSLSESYYYVSQDLKRAQIERHTEVASLQLSLDDMAFQILTLNQTIDKLQTENSDLRDEIKRQKFEKQRSMTFRRGVRGAW